MIGFFGRPTLKYYRTLPTSLYPLPKSAQLRPRPESCPSPTHGFGPVHLYISYTSTVMCNNFHRKVTDSNSGLRDAVLLWRCIDSFVFWHSDKISVHVRTWEDARAAIAMPSAPGCAVLEDDGKTIS
jgi:hypothetical protein